MEWMVVSRSLELPSWRYFRMLECDLKSSKYWRWNVHDQTVFDGGIFLTKVVPDRLETLAVTTPIYNSDISLGTAK